MRANIRASESTGTATYVYSDSGSYVDAAGTAPGQPTFGTIIKSSTTASVSVTAGNQGTNYIYQEMEYQYRASTGSYPGAWSTQTLSNGVGTIALTGLSPGTIYYIKIRNRNYDELYSPENETNFTTSQSVSITSISYNGSGTVTVTVTGGGPYYQIYWDTTGSTIPTGTYYDAAGTSTSIAESLTPTAGYSYYFWARSSTQYIASTTTSGNATAGTYTPYTGPFTMRNLTYNYNGGSDTGYTVFILNSSSTTLPTPTARTGYTFNGWYTASSGGTYVGTSGGSYSVSSTLTLYAQWTADTYTISYDANGGTGAPSSQTKTYGTALTLSSTTPTRTDYAFRGWNTNSSGTGTDYASGGSYTPNAAATLYAKWGALYTITFDSQSGTAVSAIQQSTYGGSIAKPTDPTRTNYTFGGWATSSSGTTAVTWPRTPSANETLYAIWTATAQAPGAPTNASIGTLTYAGSYMSTLLSPWQSGNATKVQTWTYDSTVTFPVNYTAGSGATSHEFYMSSSSTAPTTQNATHTSNPTAIQTDRGTITRYIWVRARNATGVSAWVSAGSKTSAATVVSGLAIKICRTGTQTCTSGSPSSQNALSYTYTSVNTGFAHDAYVSATVSGVALSAQY
jgi:uncharacterized repeat protein (TIGR02543 family)